MVRNLKHRPRLQKYKRESLVWSKQLQSITSSDGYAAAVAASIAFEAEYERQETYIETAEHSAREHELNDLDDAIITAQNDLDAIDKIDWNIMLN